MMTDLANKTEKIELIDLVKNKTNMLSKRYKDFVDTDKDSYKDEEEKK